MHVRSTGNRGVCVKPFTANAIFARAAAQAGIGAWTCDIADDTLDWTPCVYDLFGLSPADRLDRRDAVALYDEASRDTMERLRDAAIARRQPFTMEAQIIRPDGERRWLRLSADIALENGRTRRLFGLKQDITNERRRWDAMRRLAEHDPLTGLASRAVYQDVFLNARRAQPSVMPLGALVLLDLDHFKQINDRFGHAAGDACLSAVAKRLKAAFCDAPLVARIGGDEFAVLVDTRFSLPVLERRVARLLADLRRPVTWRGHRLVVGASAGIAPVDDPYRYNAEALSTIADRALYAAKASGRSAVRTMHDEQGSVIRWYETIENINQQVLNEELLQHLEFARTAAMASMASTLAHELNQPLAAIVNYVSGVEGLLRADNVVDNLPMALDALAEAKASGIRSGQIIRRLREMVAHGALKRRPENLASLIDEACTLGLSGYPVAGIEIRIDLDPDVPTIEVDRFQVKQVLIALLRNAVDAMECVEDRSIVITARRVLSNIEISVADTGAGVEPRSLARLFEVFNSIKPHAAGVSLAISRTIVEAHQGKIRYAATTNGGACFTFALPLLVEK